MSYKFWDVILLFASLFLFASGEDILCSDLSNENCTLKLQNVTTVSRHRDGFLRAVYPTSEVFDLSNHFLTRIISEIKSGLAIEPTTLNKSYYFNNTMFISETPHHRDEVPYVDLNGVTTLILSNNSVIVDVLMEILYYQRTGEDREKHQVKYLDLSYLNISWLPFRIFEQLPLKVLKLNNNPIVDIQYIQTAMRFVRYSLQELDLSGCGLRSLPDIFQDFILLKLDLSNNKLTSVPPLHYTGGSVDKLYINGNLLSVLDDTSFGEYYNVEEISAENCSIHTITAQTFSRNLRLSKLNLQNNNIRYLFPDDIPLKQTEVSLWNNPWDCTCRNLWLMRAAYKQVSRLLNPFSLRCSTPAKYAYRPLYDVARELEKLDDCDLILNNLLHKSPSQSYSFFSFMSKKAMIYFLIMAGLLGILGTVAAVVLIRKFYYKSSQQIYRPLQNIFKGKDPGYLDEKSTQHM